MKPINGWDNVRPLNEREKLPAGAYECIVKKAELVQTASGEQLYIYFDIDAGEWEGYYAEDWKTNTREDKKWKGILRQWLPKDDGSDRDEWAKARLKALTQAFEDSNRGYKWNWDERTLKGKIIGILFRNEEWEWNGKHGWTARPFKAISVDAVADGKYTIPEDKPLKGSSGTNAENSRTTPNNESLPLVDNLYYQVEDDSELPF